MEKINGNAVLFFYLSSSELLFNNTFIHNRNAVSRLYQVDFAADTVNVYDALQESLIYPVLLAWISFG